MRVRSTGMFDITEMQQYQKWQHISSIIMEFKDLSNSSYIKNDILFVNIYERQSFTSPTPQTEPRNEFLMERKKESFELARIVPFCATFTRYCM